MSWTRCKTLEQLPRQHIGSLTDLDVLQAASKPYLMEIKTESRSEVSFDKLELFFHFRAVGTHIGFLGFDPARSKLLPEDILLSLERQDDWNSRLFQVPVLQETCRGSERENYAHLFEKRLQVAPNQLSRTACCFVEYKTIMNSAFPSCSGALGDSEKSVQTWREATMVVDSPSSKMSTWYSEIRDGRPTLEEDWGMPTTVLWLR